MNLIDSHCHLSAPEWSDSLAQVLAQAQQAGVTGIFAPSAQVADWQKLLRIQQQFPVVQKIALGVHPYFVSEHAPRHLEQLNQMLADNPDVCVGEIGLDFHPHTQTAKEAQIQWFDAQVQLAKQHRRPIILHSQKSTQAIVNILKQHRFAEGGIAHAFSGSVEEANLLIKMNFKIGIGTLLLKEQAKKVKQLAQRLPLAHLVVETDAPYGLPNNGNLPQNLVQVVAQLAYWQDLPFAQVARQTALNAESVFKKSQ